MLTDRELASVILFAALIVLCLTLPTLRPVVVEGVVDVFRHLKASIIAVFGLFVLWCVAWVAVFAGLGLWTPAVAKDTTFVIFIVGFPVLFRSVGARSAAEIGHTIRSETIGLSVLLGFYLNLASLPLWGELLTQPILVVVSIWWTVARTRPDKRRIASRLGAVLAILGIGLLSWTTVFLVAHWAQLDFQEIASQLAVSIWLPVVMFPYVYAVAFYAATELLLQRMDRRNRGMPKAAVIGVFLGLRLSVRWATAMNGRYSQVAQSRTFIDALNGMKIFRRDVLRREREESNRLMEIDVLAGEPGANSAGLQLDRREFHGTKEALRFIHTAQTARFEPLGNRFWDDLADIILDPPSRYELPADHGVCVEVGPDGQVFRAWRRTRSGWVLGIGAIDRNSQYLYSGPTPPDGWPAEADEWVNSVAAEWPPDWDKNDGSRL